jgi:hypothetical protein
MTKQMYLAICEQQSIKWLQNCDARPSIGQTPMHRALVKIALRRKLRAEPSPGPIDVAWVSEYGLTQKLSNSVRCF